MENIRIPLADFRMTATELEPVIDVLRSGRLSEGSQVERFEMEWARYLGSSFCVAFSSGSTALLGGLMAAKQLGLINDGHILTNPNTYIGTANAITLAGLPVCFVDIERGSFGTLSVDGIRDAVGVAGSSSAAGRQPVGAVLPVHLFGLPERLPLIAQATSAAGIPIIEDAAQAHGSSIGAKKLGSWGLFSIFSFYMAHAVPGIEMGAVVTNDARLFRQLKSVKDQGRHGARGPESFTSYSIGLNFKANEICAAVALAHVRKLDQIMQRRRQNALVLTELLGELSDVLKVPAFAEGSCPFAYPMVLASRDLSRDQFCASLSELGVEARPMFPCIPTQQPTYGALSALYHGRLPNAEYLARSGFYVGCHEHLTSDDMRTVADSIVRIVKEHMPLRETRA